MRLRVQLQHRPWPFEQLVALNLGEVFAGKGQDLLPSWQVLVLRRTHLLAPSQHRYKGPMSNCRRRNTALQADVVAREAGNLPCLLLKRH